MLKAYWKRVLKIIKKHVEIFHLMTREEIGFLGKIFLALWNSSIFLLSEKNGGENGFMTTYPLSINLKFHVHAST